MEGLLNSRRTKRIDGQVIEVPTIGTAHVTVVQRLMRRLAPLLAEGRLTAGLPIIVTDFDDPEPDLGVLRHPVDLRKCWPRGQSLAHRGGRYERLLRTRGATAALPSGRP